MRLNKQTNMNAMTEGFNSILIEACSPHLSPRVSLIYNLVHDGGILQNELFTSRSQNLVSDKLGEHMKNEDIINSFCFSTFSFRVLYKPCILAKFKENSAKNRV